MIPSQELVRFIAAKEGFKPLAYRPLPGDKLTIGYGSTLIDGKPIIPTQTITEDEAFRILTDEVNSVGRSICRRSLPANITQVQFDAVVSLVYNIGIKAFSTSATGDLFYRGHDISDRFELYNKFKGKPTVGLTNRRLQEKEIYINGKYEA